MSRPVTKSSSLVSVLKFLFTLFTVWGSIVEAQTLSHGENVDDFVVRNIIESEVIIFSKSYCPHCRASKQTIQKQQEENPKLKVTVIELDQQDGNDGGIIQDTLTEMTGQHTVPSIFVNGMPIGGNVDLQHMAQNGYLQEMIRSAMAMTSHGV